MTDNKELIELISQVERYTKGVVTVTYDNNAMSEQGRTIIDTVQITGVKGVGPFPMSPIAAAERMRSIVHECLHGKTRNVWGRF
jgi:hypothetical protein